MYELLDAARTGAALPSVIHAVHAMNLKTRMVIDFMVANLDRKILLSELAKSAGVSISHLSHLFRTDIGISPGRYLMRLRMQRARDLLTGSLLSIKEVMAAVGFNDKSDFLRSFRKAYGESPSEYRAKNIISRRDLVQQD